jgi:hypothetical protein
MENERLSSYEQTKKTIRSKKSDEYLIDADDEFDGEVDSLLQPRRKPDFTGLTMIGTAVIIGGGVGLLAGIASIVVTASIAEVVIGGVVTKVCGIVGGAAGLGWGLRSYKKKNQQKS